MTQDVHDVLRFHSSERPGKDDQVERRRLDLDLVAGGDPVGNTLSKLGRKRQACPLDRRGVRIKSEHARRVLGDADGKTAIAAAELKHLSPTKIGESAQGGEMSTLGIEDAVHTAILSRTFAPFTDRAPPSPTVTLCPPNAVTRRRLRCGLRVRAGWEGEEVEAATGKVSRRPRVR